MRPLPLVLLVLAVTPAAAQPAPPAPSAAQARVTEARAAITDAVAHAVRGPASLALSGGAHIALPANMLWMPGDYARRVLRSWGNSPGGNTLGMFAARNAGHDWVAVVSLTQDGHVRDDDSASLNAADILGKLREGQEEANKDRFARGFPGLELTGWLQPPAYDTRTHRLVWALLLEDADGTDANPTVNYNTRNLGRDNYISLNLITSRNDFAADKPLADRLLNGFAFDPGHAYRDFNAGTDHVAEYGLAALIGVVALKKLGLLALMAAFVLKFAKLGALAVVAAGAALRRIFRRQPRTAASRWMNGP